MYKRYNNSLCQITDEKLIMTTPTTISVRIDLTVDLCMILPMFHRIKTKFV